MNNQFNTQKNFGQQQSQGYQQNQGFQGNQQGGAPRSPQSWFPLAFFFQSEYGPNLVEGSKTFRIKQTKSGKFQLDVHKDKFHLTLGQIMEEMQAFLTANAAGGQVPQQQVYQQPTQQYNTNFPPNTQQGGFAPPAQQGYVPQLTQASQANVTSTDYRSNQQQQGGFGNPMPAQADNIPF